MRTVDPENWSKTIRKAPLNLTRPLRFGKKAQEAYSGSTKTKFREHFRGQLILVDTEFVTVHQHKLSPKIVTKLRFRRSGVGLQVVEPKRSGFHKALDEYKRNCTVSGVKYITDETNPAFVRYSYAVLLFLLLCFGVFTLGINSYERALNEPSTVSPRAGRAVRDVPFPAVGLCSNHIVTTRALTSYTASLMAKKQYRNKTYSEAAIARNLAYLGHLLTMSMPYDLDTSFMSFVTSLDLRASEASLLSIFAPKCSSMLVRCSWRGQTLPCQDLFQTRVTPLGYCCVFNSRYHPRDVYKLPQFLDIVGKDYGLSVVVQQDFDDVSFYRRPSNDIDILIFDGNDYPLLEGGGARLFPAEGGASVYLALSATLHYPEEGFDHDIETLHCRSRRWSGEREQRSHAWCLATCRARALEDLCACTLFILPLPHDHKHKRCSLEHLDCLNKHREKLVQYRPRGVSSAWELLARNAQDCTHCAPDCARVVYTAAAAASHVRRQPFEDRLTKDIPAENLTTIRLYYSSRQVMSYVFQSNASWYEKFVQLGSEWALIVGASVVSVGELVFHCCLRRRRRRTATQDITIESLKV